MTWKWYNANVFLCNKNIYAPEEIVIHIPEGMIIYSLEEIDCHSARSTGPMVDQRMGDNLRSG